ncbi:MAG TPA: SsrA-binding protein SmpB [Flavobacteriaceae bacterium]|nr:SsrA-binding protein SmpB [Flavobacteriaceae bacterium]
MKFQKNIEIKNRKAAFNYEFIEKFTTGIVLKGTEIKSLREGKASIAESFCEFKDGELFVINMTIEAYSHAFHFNHKPKSERKLLLTKRELKKLDREVRTTGLTIVPLRLFINENGLAKMEIALARGKKDYDKRESIKERDTKRDINRLKKSYSR